MCGLLCVIDVFWLEPWPLRSSRWVSRRWKENYENDVDDLDLISLCVGQNSSIDASALVSG